MRKILEHYCLSENSNGLLLLSMPTGFGKTYNVLNFIYEHYQEFFAQGRKILFITNLKKNLPISELRDRFEKDGKINEFERNVLFIDSNADSIIKNLASVDSEIPDSFKTSKYSRLKSYIETLNQKNQLPAVKDIFASEIKRELEPAFRKFVTEALYKEFKTKSARLSAIKNNRDFQWIGKLYPAAFTDERTVLFLSMDKFVVKNTTLIEQSYYFHERFADNTLIFIDEFDATKEFVLKSIIESGMKHRINLLDLFLNIHNHLMQNECPEGLLQESVYRKQIQEKIGRKWLSPRELIESFKEKAEQIFQKYKLQHTCKSHEDFSTDKRNFLFYDYQFHNVLDARNKRIEIIQDHDNRANWINAVDFENTVRGFDIRTLLSEISGFLSYYQRGISYIADNYRHLKNEDDAIQEAFPLESAVRTTLNHFRLDVTDVEFLCKNIMEGEMPYVGREDRIAIQRQNFYETGFRYHDIIDSEEHDTLSKIYMYNFSQTPESFLSGICTKALVVGISATAGLYTNIGNYDLEYLKSRLGKSFIRLDGEDLQRLKINFEETTKGYEQVELKINFIDSGSREESIVLLEDQLGDREAAIALWNKLRSSLPDKDENAISNIYSRYLRVLTVWKYFLETPSSRAFLCLISKLPKVSEPSFDLAIIQEYASLIGESIFGENYRIEKNAIVVLSSENYEECKNKLLSELQKGQRKFILSTYQTVGAGQNLQYPIPEKADTIQINLLPARSDMDIDGIYLDRPTNLIVNIYNDTIKDNDFIKYLFQLEFLVENGAVSPKAFKSKLDEAFHRYVGRRKPKHKLEDFTSLYNTDAYTRYLNKMIIQAVGRMCRSNMKAPTIHILADAFIKKHLINFDLPDDVIPVREYSALANAVGGTAQASADWADAQNRAASRSNRTAAYINKQINTPWTEESILEWQELRKQTLKQPAISRENACDYKWRNIYVCLPIPAYSYFYAEDNDYRDVEIFFTVEQGKRQVSERAARLTELMEIPLLTEYFKSAGWTISFPKSELMLTPPIFNNIYKGALGEVCGAYIFKELLGINLFELDVHEFELFDFKTADGIYVDFKLWSDQIGIEAEEQIDKIRSKIDKTSASRVYIVNILASENTQFKSIISKDGNIIEVPFLCKNGDINEEAMHFIRKEFCR